MGAKVLKVKEFSLEHTLESGQFFRYEKLEDSDWDYRVFTQGKVIDLRQKGSNLEYEGASESFVKEFLGLNHDFARIKREISKDRYVREAMKEFPGLRIMKQDPWEATIGFVVSQNNNIKRIRKSLAVLSEQFGKKINYKNKVCYLFPAIGSLNSMERIEKARIGYRDDYLFCVNKDVSEQYFRKIVRMNYKTAFDELRKLEGVGPKVADCILLFGYNRFEAFPIDTHVRKLMKSLYLGNKKVSDREIKEFALRHFGKYAGYAQQYLFHLKRKREGRKN